MATSNRAGRGFWWSAVGRWLGSTKNIVGGVLAVAAVVAHLLLGLGAYWPFVVVAAYLVGALAAPSEKVDVRLQLESGQAIEAGQLRAQLDLLRRHQAKVGRRLPGDGDAMLGRILENLELVVARWGELQGASTQAHTAQAMILDYLPTSLQRYLSVPSRSTAVAARPGERSPDSEILEQLALLDGEAGRLHQAVYARDMAALEDQSRFLREKFGKSELDLS